jgi:hypothetical protein
MPNASTTQSSSASETTGQPIPLAYGYAWATGKRHCYYQLGEPLTTGQSGLDFTRVGIWLLGHGEWDGPIELWLNDKLAWNGDSNIVSTWMGQQWTACLDNANQNMVFNFHRGSDSTIGTGLAPVSNGPDQGVDVLYAAFPPAVQALAFSRIAYYAIMRKQPIENQTNTHQTDPTQWTDIAPVGLWRALRCRLFDDQGSQTGYAWTTNPAWHYVDVLLRRKIFPDFGIDLNGGPDPLPSAVQNRFDWGPIYSAAQYFDEFLANGRRRFEGNYSFSQQTTLQAVIEQILLCCRSFSSEYAGKISLKCDMPRSSVFTFSQKHILPGSWQATDQALHTGANRYIATFRGLLVPQCSLIESIIATIGVLNGLPNVTTQQPHPFESGDLIAIGGTGTPYDRNWVIKDVPDIINAGQPDEVDPTTFTLTAQGENFPGAVGSVGGCGLLYSRFKERSPEFWHKANMMARGVVGLGLPRQRMKVKQNLDFATTTWDQAARLTMYERDRTLGVDPTNAAGQLGSPYVTPPRVKLRTSMFAKDIFGNLAAAIQNGDRVSLDTTVNFQYAGEYEVLEPLTVQPPTCAAAGSGGAIALRPDESSGEIEFSLGPYDESVMYDASDPLQAGWLDVPGSDPGNNASFTSIPLADGIFAFFTGMGASGSAYSLPSTGFPVGNVLAWAGPAGYLYTGNDLNVIGLCGAGTDAPHGLILKYDDNSGNIWLGPLNFAVLTWLSADVTNVSNGLTWLPLTLLGGEEIVFGMGVVAGDGSFTVELPAGCTTAQSFMVAYPHDGVPGNGNHAHFLGAYVDSDQVVHLNYKDGEGNVWHGNAAVLVFAWKNNMGSVTTQTLTNGAPSYMSGTGTTGNWMQCTLSNGQVFGVGCALSMSDGATLALPATTITHQNVIAINCGGAATGIWVADRDYSAQMMLSTGAAINTSSVVNPAPQAVYQTENYGAMTYTIPGLNPSEPYIANLHFAEIYFNGAGAREFNVSINGTQVLANFDVFAAAGGKNIAIVKSFEAAANGSGEIVIELSIGSMNVPKISGIQILGQIPGSTSVDVSNALEAIVGTSGWDYGDNGTPATGVKASYLDADNMVHIEFGDSDGSIVWPGAADVFALYCTSGLAVPTVVNVMPPTASVAAGASMQFTAAVLSNANPNVSWSVDGVAGGNVTVGTVDSTGFYSAPNAEGPHEIVATSVADPTASGSAAIAVWGTLLPDPGNILETNGLIITVDGEEIDVE